MMNISGLTLGVIIMCLVAPELSGPIMTDSLFLNRLTIFCRLHKTTSTGIKSLSSFYCVILDIIATQHMVFPSFSGDQSNPPPLGDYAVFNLPYCILGHQMFSNGHEKNCIQTAMSE